jgi:hypothetical protein
MLMFTTLVAMAALLSGGCALMRLVRSVPRDNADFALPGGRP